MTVIKMIINVIVISQVGIFVSKERDLKKKKYAESSSTSSSSTFKLYLNIHHHSVVAVFSNNRLISSDKSSIMPIVIENEMDNNAMIENDNDMEDHDYGYVVEKRDSKGIDNRDDVKMNERSRNERIHGKYKNDGTNNNNNDNNNNNSNNDKNNCDYDKKFNEDMKMNESMKKEQFDRTNKIQNKLSVDYKSISNNYYNNIDSEEKNRNENMKSSFINIAEDENNTNYDHRIIFKNNNMSPVDTTYNTVTLENSRMNSRVNSMTGLCDIHTNSRNSHTNSMNSSTNFGFINSQLSKLNTFPSEFYQNSSQNDKNNSQRDMSKNDNNYKIGNETDFLSKNTISQTVNPDKIRSKLSSSHAFSRNEEKNEISVFTDLRSQLSNFAYDNDGNKINKKRNSEDSKSKVSFINNGKNNNDNSDNNNNWEVIPNSRVSDYNDFDDYRDLSSYTFCEKNNNREENKKSSGNNDIFDDQKKFDGDIYDKFNHRNRKKGTSFFDSGNDNNDIDDNYVNYNDDDHDGHNDKFNDIINQTNTIINSAFDTNDDNRNRNSIIHDKDNVTIFYQDKISESKAAYYKNREIQNPSISDNNNTNSQILQKDQILRNNNYTEIVTLPSISNVKRRSVD